MDQPLTRDAGPYRTIVVCCVDAGCLLATILQLAKMGMRIGTYILCTKPGGAARLAYLDQAGCQSLKEDIQLAVKATGPKGPERFVFFAHGHPCGWYQEQQEQQGSFDTEKSKQDLLTAVLDYRGRYEQAMVDGVFFHHTQKPGSPIRPELF